MGAFPICLFGYTLSFSVPTFNAAGPQLNTPWQNLMAALRVHLSLPVTHLLTNNQNTSENTCRRNGSVWKLHLSSDKMQYRAELSRDEDNARSLAVAMTGLLPAHIQTLKNITPGSSHWWDERCNRAENCLGVEMLKVVLLTEVFDLTLMPTWMTC